MQELLPSDSVTRRTVPRNPTSPRFTFESVGLPTENKLIGEFHE